MGLFSRVHADLETPCQTCGAVSTRVIQFKFGDCRLRDYRIGVELRWEANVVGAPGHRRVLVSGHPEPCLECRVDDDCLYEVDIRGDRIVGVRPVGNAGQELTLFGPEGYRTED